MDMAHPFYMINLSQEDLDFRVRRLSGNTNTY